MADAAEEDVDRDVARTRLAAFDGGRSEEAGGVCGGVGGYVRHGSLLTWHAAWV
jgi:hypothetical protein